jgi:hypothetical protein
LCIIQKEIKIQIIASNSIITNINSTKFLGLIIDSILSWNDQIVELTSKLNKACYAIRAIKPLMSLVVLRTIYFSYVQSVTSYGIVFWGNSHHNMNIFKIQKRIMRIITNIARRDSCHQLFKQLQILALSSQNIFSLLLFVNKNREMFLSNSEIHDTNTQYNYNLHLPSTNLALLQKGVLYSGSKVYNCLPSNIKVLPNDAKRFKSTLKSYLIEQAFYSLHEYYQSTFQ